ncbi:activating transcription factor of chaperone isoform X2 [Phlebotomus argentipes]|uniref:activating transcription factor of chaperone isoform X2 n=1 Tax=Phlebotomus argentipes TaxID=94469 RepID=UPI0028933439|nr:activating transcription factor of chaperone isoform X2 [Phlebotomus argentipes]
MSTYMISTYEQWLNEKMVMPSIDEYPPPPLEPIAVKKQDTQELLQEFEIVYDAVELTHLTPPQTPPQTSPQRLTIAEAAQCIDQTFIYQEPVLYETSSSAQSFYTLPEQQSQKWDKCENALQYTLSPFAAAGQEQQAVVDGDLIEIVQSPMPEDIDHEMKLVDELVRSRAQDLPDWTDDDDNSSEFMSTPASLSPRSEASFSASSYSHDEDWVPETRVKASKVAGLGGGAILGGGGVTKKRTRPYARGSEDKKSRKKEQNKNAATRYRKKKKQEIEEVLEEERGLQQEHEKLRVEAADLKREIKYLKGLMREVYKAKGLLD